MDQTPILAPLVCTLKQTAELLNLSERTVQRFVDRGILTTVPGIRRTLIPRKQIEAYVNKAPAPFCPMV